MSTVTEFFYRQAALAFIAMLGQLTDLADKIRRACQEHLENGFVAYAVENCRRFRVWAGGGGAFFVVQDNPYRASRKGAAPGLPIPRPLAARGLSRLHPEVIPFTSAWRQYAVPVTVNGRRYWLLPQPWPMGKNHAVLASAEEGDGQDAIEREGGVRRIMTELCEMAGSAAGMLVFWNGIGAGCSIRETCHFQLMERDPDGWPLERVCDRVRMEDGSAVVTDAESYPLAAWSYRGEAVAVAQRGTELVERYYRLAGGNASVNLLAVADGGEVTVYIVPRDRRYEAAVMGGAGELVVGSLEVFGELIVESRPIPAALCDYGMISRMLGSVRPMSVAGLAGEEGGRWLREN